MELRRQLARMARIFWPAPLATRASDVERDARYLVQKLAREAAAERALCVLTAATPDRMDPNTYADHVLVLAEAKRRWQTARLFRCNATMNLRETLNLPTEPTAVEVDGWGLTR